VNEILQENSFDGLVIYEGGEGNLEGGQMGVHDSYMIMDPDKTKIVSETLLDN